MRLIYYFIGGLIVFIIRQILVPLLGPLADLVLVVPATFFWLWLEDNSGWWLLIVAACLVDIILARVLPFYTLASLTSIIIYYGFILPYLSHSSTLTRFFTFILAILLWRLFYITWLAIGWLVGGQILLFEQSLFWSGLAWLGLGLVLLLIVLGLKQLFWFIQKKVAV